MFRLKFFASILFSSLFALSYASAETLNLSGADSSGGGKVVACRDSAGYLKSVELLDLFEARALYGLIPSPDLASEDDYLAFIRTKLGRTFDSNYFAYQQIEEARSHLRLLPSGTELMPLDDAQEIALPRGCKTEQLAVYRQNVVLLVNRDLWEALDARNKAALFVHEGTYRRDRELGAKNSIFARKITAHLFSTFEFDPPGAGVPENSKACSVVWTSGGTRSFMNFFLYENPEHPNSAILQFIAVENRPIHSKTIAKVGLTETDRPLTEYARLESKFETLRGVSVEWKSKERLLQGELSFLVNDGEEVPASCQR